MDFIRRFLTSLRPPWLRKTLYINTLLSWYIWVPVRIKKGSLGDWLMYNLPSTPLRLIIGYTFVSIRRCGTHMTTVVGIGYCCLSEFPVRIISYTYAASHRTVPAVIYHFAYNCPIQVCGKLNYAHVSKTRDKYLWPATGSTRIVQRMRAVSVGGPCNTLARHIIVIIIHVPI